MWLTSRQNRLKSGRFCVCQCVQRERERERERMSEGWIDLRPREQEEPKQQNPRCVRRHRWPHANIGKA